MARFDHVQTSFIAGEITPRVRGRLDFENFFKGADELLNFIVLPHGSISRRPGTRFVAEVKNSSLFTRLLPFTFSSDQAYIIEAGNLYFRFFADEGQLVDDASGAQTIIGINQTTDTFTVTGDFASRLTQGDTIVVDGSTGNDGLYVVVSATDLGANTDVIVSRDIPSAVVDGTLFTPVEIISTYPTADLPFIRYTQSADIMFLVHPEHKPKELQRTDDVTWALVDFVHTDGPYLDTIGSITTLALSGLSGSVTCTASNTTEINGGAGFLATDVGRLIRRRDQAASSWSWMEITAVNTTTSVTATVKGPAFTDTTASTNWRLGAWSETSGWPHSVTFHQERLWFGGTDEQPQTVWSSASGDFSAFTPSALADGTVLDSHAITATAASNSVNAIRWMISTSKGLLIGT